MGERRLNWAPALRSLKFAASWCNWSAVISVPLVVSRVEFLLRVLRRVLEDAGVRPCGGMPVSLQVALIVEQIRLQPAFPPELEPLTDRVLGLSLNLELAIDEGAALEPARAPVLAALDALDRRLAGARPA